MSKPRIHVWITLDNLSHANSLLGNFNNVLLGKDVFETVDLQAYDDSTTQGFFFYEAQFNSLLDRDTVKDWVVNQIQNVSPVKNWVKKVKISWHRCTHDEVDAQDCRTTDYGEFVK